MGVRTDWLLPPDLEFIIIDHFLDDKVTLASCSLVCSRWLPHSRKHLFNDVTIKPAKHLCRDPLAGFLHVVERSGDINVEWAIGKHVKRFKLDGRRVSWALGGGPPTTPCFLNILRALLTTLPHLTSLCVCKCLILNHTSQEPNVQQCERPRFELDELVISGCLGLTEDPSCLLRLLCTFSNISSLSVHRWGRRGRGPLLMSSPVPFSPPIVRSLAVELVEDVEATRALYALLASSLSVTNACLTRLSVHAAEWEDLRMFVDFANIAGAALQNIELRIQSDIRLDLLHDLSLTASTTLSSLTLSIECIFVNLAAASDEQAEGVREALREYTAILNAHRDTFAALTAVRLEMWPVGWQILDSFVYVAQDVHHVWRTNTVQPVEPHEAERNSQVWVSLEHALCDFPALQRVEFVLCESSARSGESLVDAAKVELESALESRLRRLWPSGIAQLVFEHYPP